MANYKEDFFSKALKNCCDKKLNLKIVGIYSNLIIKMRRTRFGIAILTFFTAFFVKMFLKIDL